MTKIRHIIAGSALIFLSGMVVPTALLAKDYTVGSIHIEHPTARVTVPGAVVGAGYMRLVNDGKADDTLLSVHADIAGKTEVHKMSVKNGVMKMRRLMHGLKIPHGGSVELKPGSYHIMFMHLKKQIKKGDKIKAELRFKNAGKVDVVFDATQMKMMKMMK